MTSPHRKHSMRLTLLATCLLAIPFAAQAQEGPVIVVTGQGLDQSPATPAYDVTVLTREQITSAASNRLEDALASIAGFQQFRRSDSRSSNPSAQGATLRALGGNATSRALILLDGVPIADPFFGYIPFSSVAPETLQTIRVTRGGGSGPFGAGALAGTIELESADPANLGLLNLQELINDRREIESSGTFAPQVGEGFAVISGRWDRGQGFWTTPVDERADATARAKYESWSSGARLVQPLGDDLELQLRGQAFRDTRTLRFEGADNSSSGKDVSARLVSRGPWQVDAIAYGQWRNFTNVVISSTRFVRVLDQKDTPSTGMGGKLEIRPPVGGGHTLRLGADYRRSNGNLFEDAYSAFSGNRTEQRFAGGTNSDIGLFAEDDWELGPVVLTGGVRADRYRIADGYYRAFDGSGATLLREETYADRADWTYSWRGGAVFNASEALRLRAAAYSGFRLPTLNELYRPFVVFPVTTNANAALQPERLEGFEAGLDWTATDNIRFSLTAFDNEVKNAVANVTVATNTRQRQNLDAIDAQGIEFGASITSGAFSLDSSLAWTDAVMRSGVAADLDGNRPAQTPNWSASTTLKYESQGGAVLAATLRHVAAQFETDLEDDVLPAATTVDLFGQLPLGAGFSAIARVENLLDETIITRNQGGSMDLGVPMTMWAGLRFGF